MFLDIFCNKKVSRNRRNAIISWASLFFKRYCCFSCFRHFFCNQKCPETGKSLEDYDLFKGFGCFSVTWHFWIQYSLSLIVQVGMIHDVGIIIVKMSSCVHIEIQLNTELISIFVVMYFLFRWMRISYLDPNCIPIQIRFHFKQR